MAKYDFNLLHDDDFQRLGCHVVCLRENFEIESFSKYKDKGIDGLYQNKNTKIVIQCKRYKNFNSLFSNLKNKELDKVKKISPSRYILVLATKINKEQKTKILKLFKDYIIDDKDIITGDDLEYYFTENKYEEAKNEYLSYLSPSYSEYKKMLDLNINKAIYKDTEWLINDILKYSKYFVATQSFNKAKKALNESKIILLTGDPGSGKTTNAVMLIDYLYKNKKIKEFYKVNSCKDIMSLLDENISQAFFIDDFWGSTNVFQKFNPEEENKLLYIIEHLESANNTYLILTTREYILQQKMNNFKNLKSLVTDKRIFFKNNKYTKIEKINILLKHAASSNLDLDYIAKLTYNADYIVSLPNYSPRFVSSYLDKITDIKKDSMTFVKDFIDYLDHPYDYFSNIFNDFSLGAKMILYLLGLVSSLEYEDLKYSFIKVAKKLDNINPSEFDDYLHELESSWIDINVRDNKVFFTNYTYEEYTLEILKNKIIDFIDVLIEELPIFNFIFNIINMNIQLDDRIKDKVIERIIKEYDYWKVLDDYNYAFWARKDLNQGDIIWQLIRIAKEYKSFKLLNFIKDKVILNIENYKFNIFNVEDDDLGSVPELLKKLEELGIDLDMEDLIIKYISKAVTMNQIYALRYLPLKYQPYIKNYLKNIFTQDNIIEKLCCDLWLLSYDGFTMKYEMLLDDFPDILKYLGLKLTKEIKTIINDNKLDHHDNNYKFDNKPNKENIKIEEIIKNSMNNLDNIGLLEDKNILDIINKTNLNINRKKILIDSLDLENGILNDNFTKDYLKLIIKIFNNKKLEKLDWNTYPIIEEFIKEKLMLDDILFLEDYAFYLKEHDNYPMNKVNFLNKYNISYDLLNKMIKLGILKNNKNFIFITSHNFIDYLFVKNVSRKLYKNIFLEEVTMFDFFDTINVRKYYLCPAFRNVVKDIKNNNSLFKDSILNITINGDTSTANYNNDYMIVEEFLEEFFSSSFWTDIVNIIKIKNKIIDAKEYFKNASSEDKTKLEDLVKYYSDLIIKILDYLENDKRIFKYFMEENNFKFLILE